MRCRFESFHLYIKTCRHIESSVNFKAIPTFEGLRSFIATQLQSQKLQDHPLKVLTPYCVTLNTGRLYVSSVFTKDFRDEQSLFEEIEIIYVEKNGKVSIHELNAVEQNNFSCPLKEHSWNDYIADLDDRLCLPSESERLEP